MKVLKIHDSTLREGEQAPGHSMSVNQKIELVSSIDATGVDFIEAGFPAASLNDFKFAKKVSQLKNSLDAKISCLARGKKEDIDITHQAFSDVSNIQLGLLLVGSEIHLQHKLNISPEQAIAQARESISYAKSLGFVDIAAGFEDSFRGSKEYLEKITKASVEQGASTIIFADTVGAATPIEIHDLILEAKKWVNDSVTLSIHCHNDMGLALANSLGAILAEADCIQTTFCGIGERTGITALEELATVLQYKSQLYKARTKIDLRKTYKVCKSLIKILKFPISYETPIIGRNAFSSAAGIHIKGLLRNPITYEYVNPHLFGRHRELFISRLSGSSIIKDNLTRLGLPFSKKTIEEMHKIITASSKAEEYNNIHKFITLYKKVNATINASKA